MGQMDRFRAAKKYGRCPDCGFQAALTKDGKLRRHVYYPGPQTPMMKGEKCPGTGKDPKPDMPIEGSIL